MVTTTRSPVETLDTVRRVGRWLSTALFGFVLVAAVVGTLALAGVDAAALVTLGLDSLAAAETALVASLVLAILGTLAAVLVAVADS